MSRGASLNNRKNKFPAHRVRSVDCIKGMADLEEQSVDVVVTSPPYNIGTNYNIYMDVLEQVSYLDWCLKWTRTIRKVLK